MGVEDAPRVGNAFIIRIVAFLLVICSVAEIIVATISYSFLENVHLGAWWGAICTLIAGILGCIAAYRVTMIAAFSLSILGFLGAVVGGIVDCIAISVFEGLSGCANTHTNQMYGSHAGKYYAGECVMSYILSANTDDTDRTSSTDDATIFQYLNGSWYYNHRYNYYYNHPYNSPYINHTHSTSNYYFQNHPPADDDNYDDGYYSSYYSNGFNFYYNHPYYFMNHNDFTQPYQCVCADGRLCYGYDLTTGENCGEIMTTYASLLTTSTALLSALCLLSFCLAVVIGINLFKCGNSSNGRTSVAVDSSAMAMQATSKYMVAPVQIQEGGSLPPGAVIMMMVPSGGMMTGQSAPHSQNVPSKGHNSGHSGRRASRPSALPTVLED